MEALPKRLAFDNHEILEYALWRLRNKVGYADVAFQLLPRILRSRDYARSMK